MLVRANSILRTNIAVSSPQEPSPPPPLPRVQNTLLIQCSEDGITHLVDLVDFILRARRLSASMVEPQDKISGGVTTGNEQRKRASIASSTSVLSVASIQSDERPPRKETVPTMIVTSSDEEEAVLSASSSSSSSRQLVSRPVERQPSDASSHRFRRSDSANSIDQRLRLITVDGMLASSEKRVARPLTPPSTISGRSSPPAPSLPRDADDNRSLRKRLFRTGSLSEKFQESMIQRRASVVKRLKSAVRRPSAIIRL